MQKQVIRFLESQGFRGLSLITFKNNVFTFSYNSVNFNALVRTFGAPSVAGGGKVAVFDCQPYGKVGVSQENTAVRVVWEHKATEKFVDKSHLAKLPVPQELQVLYQRGLSSGPTRIKFLTSAWEYFNKTKFSGKLTGPTILCSSLPRASVRRLFSSSVRGYFRAGMPVPGELWIKADLFSADIDFMVEILVHEMAHQAVAEIDQVKDTSEGGHGRNWQAWMRKVGLDPRRYDPTPDSVYSPDSPDLALEDLRLTQAYGPKSSAASLRALKILPGITTGTGLKIIFKDRIATGKIVTVRGKYKFLGKTESGKPISLQTDKPFKVYE